MKAIVVGGGIGGLATAIALRRDGHEVVLVERADALGTVGAGIALAANALRVLDGLGAGAELRRRGGIARRILLLDRRGGVLNELDVQERGWEILGVHRADLQDVLVWSAGRIRLGAACTGFSQHDGGVTVRLDEGTELEGDVLVGADGIRSTVRAQLKGEEPLRFAGYFGWRAVIDFPDPSLADRFSESWGPTFRVGLVTIGRGRIYWFVSERADGDAALPPDPKSYFREKLRDWHDPIPEVVGATPDGALTRLPIHDRKPARRWGEGRVTLLGDAAHPMTPNLGQGAAQALEDAAVLAAALRSKGDVESALRAYEARRIPRTAMIVNRSYAIGRIAQLGNPVACRLRDALVKATPKRVQVRQQELVVGAEA